MRLLVRVAAAISSMRAPLKPLLANSAVATSRIPAMVRAGSLVRVVGLPALVSSSLAECTNWFICQV